MGQVTNIKYQIGQVIIINIKIYYFHYVKHVLEVN